MAISYQPWNQGCTYPAWDIPLLNDAAADDLVANNVNQSTFTMTFRPATGAADIPGTGSFSVKATSPAEVLYQPSAADVANVFSGYLFVKATTTDGRLIVWDPIGGTGSTLAAPVPFLIVAA